MDLCGEAEVLESRSARLVRHPQFGHPGEITNYPQPARLLRVAHSHPRIITAALTGPGQTIGVSVFVDHFIADLELSRSGVSTAYLIGTLLAALGLPYVGQKIDHIGIRRAMTAIGILFGVTLAGMAGVQGFITLTIGFVAIRLFGQGSLSLVSTVSVTLWFERMRGTALGILSTAMSVLMALVPVGLSLVIEGYDWRIAWLTAAVVIWLVVVPIARFGLIDRPSDIGQFVDGTVPERHQDAQVGLSMSTTRSEALRKKAFSVAGDLAGNYDTAARWYALVPIAAGLAALTLKPVPPPQHWEKRSRSLERSRSRYLKEFDSHETMVS